MDNNFKKDYTLKISNANKNELLIINFDICLMYIKKSCELLNGNKTVVFSKRIDEKDKKDFVNYTNYAKKSLDELIQSLNFKYEISNNLLQLYMFINEILIKSKFIYDKSKLKLAEQILIDLKESFVSIIENDSNEENNSKVYAGLTYSNDGLNEVILNSNKNYEV